MISEPLIQKLFAIERAIGQVPPAALRAMVIEAEEAALRMELDSVRQTWNSEGSRSGSHAAHLPGDPAGESGLPRIA